MPTAAETSTTFRVGRGRRSPGAWKEEVAFSPCHQPDLRLSGWGKKSIQSDVSPFGICSVLPQALLPPVPWRPSQVRPLCVLQEQWRGPDLLHHTHPEGRHQRWGEVPGAAGLPLPHLWGHRKGCTHAPLLPGEQELSPAAAAKATHAHRDHEHQFGGRQDGKK